MVSNDQAWLSEEQVKSKILQTMEGISAGENWKVAVNHDGNVPHISDTRAHILQIHRRYFCIYGGDKTVSLKNFGRSGGESALGKNHHQIVLNAGAQLMALHSGACKLRPCLQDFRQNRGKLGRRVIAAMN